MEKGKKKKIGLALGSGGFRGLAHLGVLQVLAENGIPIDCISGASIGSLVAAYYAVNGEVNSLIDWMIGDKKNKLVGLSDFGLRGGLVSSRKFGNFIDKIMARRTFSDVQIPLRILATDLASGQPFVFKSGRLSAAIRASSSVPVVFEPAKEQGRHFVDGALSSPVPIDVLKDMGADYVIAVNLYHKREFIEKRFTFAKVALRSTRIALYNLAQHSIASADVVINPDTSEHIKDFSIKKYFTRSIIEEMVKIGRREALKKLPEIKQLLDR